MLETILLSNFGLLEVMLEVTLPERLLLQSFLAIILVLILYTKNAGSANTAVSILPSGNVGINTPTPQNTLNVLGTANITGSMIIGKSNITTLSNGDVNVW
jgi:hypothetical protein